MRGVNPPGKREREPSGSRCRGETGEKFRVAVKLGKVLEGEPDGPAAFTGNDKRCDLDDLAVTPGSRARVPARTHEVAGGADIVALAMHHHGEQGVLNGQLRHGGSVRRHADRRLSWH